MRWAWIAKAAQSKVLRQLNPDEDPALEGFSTGRFGAIADL
jgi:hypothetical protein